MRMQTPWMLLQWNIVDDGWKLAGRRERVSGLMEGLSGHPSYSKSNWSDFVSRKQRKQKQRHSQHRQRQFGRLRCVPAPLYTLVFIRLLHSCKGACDCDWRRGYAQRGNKCDTAEDCPPPSQASDLARLSVTVLRIRPSPLDASSYGVWLPSAVWVPSRKAKFAELPTMRSRISRFTGSLWLSG